MNTLAHHQKTIEEFSASRNKSLQDKTAIQEYFSSSKLFGQEDIISSHILRTKKKLGVRLQSLKRVSPFLLLEFFLLALFPYMMISGGGLIHNKWVLVFLFIFIEINVLFIDFALWNYFKGKKIFRIWMIEIPLAFLIIHFLI